MEITKLPLPQDTSRININKHARPTAAVRVSDPLPVLTALGLKPPAVATTGDRLSKMHFDHGLTRADLKALPGLLADPVMVFESDAQPGAKVPVLDLWRHGAPVIAAVKPEVDLKRVQVNLLASAYPKDQIEQLGRWIGARLLRYADKEKTRGWATNGGVQFPWLVQLQRGSRKSVLGPADIGNDPGLSRSGGLPIATATAIAPNLAASGVHINVAATVNELPPDRKASLLARDPSGQARGVYFPDSDEVWVIASNLSGIDETVFVALHESFHRGLSHRTRLLERRLGQRISLVSAKNLARPGSSRSMMRTGRVHHDALRAVHPGLAQAAEHARARSRLMVVSQFEMSVFGWRGLYWPRFFASGSATSCTSSSMLQT